MPTQTIVGEEQLQSGRVSYGERDPSTGQRYEVFTPGLYVQDQYNPKNIKSPAAQANQTAVTSVAQSNKKTLYNPKTGQYLSVSPGKNEEIFAYSKGFELIDPSKVPDNVQFSNSDILNDSRSGGGAGIRYPVGGSTYGDAVAEFYGQFSMPNDEQIRQDMNKRAQVQVDAINAVYDRLVRQDEIAGRDRLGQTRAMAARGGLIGSDFGGAQMDKTQQYNNDVIAARRAEQASKVAAVFDKFDERAAQQIEAEKTRALQGGQAYLDYLKQQQTDARNDVVTVAKSGVLSALDQLDEEDYTNLLKQTGYSPLMLESVFNANKPKEQQIEYQVQNLGNGQVLFYGVDPKTGTLIQKNFDYSVPQGMELKFAQDGTPLLFDPNTNTLKIAEGFEQGQFDDKPTEADSVQDLISRYPDAGITLSDTLQQAQAKLPNSAIYRKAVRVGGSGGGGSAKGATVKFSSDDTARLVNAGFSTTDISNLQENINGGVTVDEIIESANLNDDQQKALRNVLSGVTPTQEQGQGELDDRGIRQEARNKVASKENAGSVLNFLMDQGVEIGKFGDVLDEALSSTIQGLIDSNYTEKEIRSELRSQGFNDATIAQYEDDINRAPNRFTRLFQ